MISNMEKRKYTPPRIEIVQVDASEILVIIADSATDIQWAPRHNYDEDSFGFEGNNDYDIMYFDDKTRHIWE